MKANLHNPTPNDLKNTPNPAAFFRSRLPVNMPNNAHEQEADGMASRVMRMASYGNENTFFRSASTTVQRKCQQCEDEEKLHRKESSDTETQGSHELDSYVGSLGSSGQALPDSSRQFFEPRFGHDFSNVRIHTDSVAAKSAQSINALAYTTGNNIVFNSGQFSPESDSGKRLMAHELTHVVQQGSGIGTKLIQKLDCDLTHLDNECTKAPDSCHKADSYCAKKYPKDADIAALQNKVSQSAKDKAKQLPLASVNLLHYLDNTGTVLVMPSASFENEASTKNKLKTEHRDKFISGAQKRLEDGRLTSGGTVDMVWTGTANAFTALDDMSFAVGGYTLCSKVTVQAVPQGGNNFKIVFQKWTVQGFDCYNWDPGKGIGQPGFDDNDLCCLENSGKAKHYRIQTDSWDNKEPDSIADASVTATLPAPAGGPKAPPAPSAPPSKWEKFKKWLGF
jgi:hypothetical protein